MSELQQLRDRIHQLERAEAIRRQDGRTSGRAWDQLQHDLRRTWDRLRALEGEIYAGIKGARDAGTAGK